MTGYDGRFNRRESSPVIDLNAVIAQADDFLRERQKQLDKIIPGQIEPAYDEICECFAKGDMDGINRIANKFLVNIVVNEYFAMAYQEFFKGILKQPEEVIGSYNGKQVTTHSIYSDIFRIAADGNPKIKQLLAAAACSAYESDLNCKEFYDKHKDEIRNINHAIFFNHPVLLAIKHELGYDNRNPRR